MCLIIYKPADKEVPIDRMRSAFNINNDGWGIMAFSKQPEGNRQPLIITKKPVPGWSNGSFNKEFEEFLSVYEQYKDHRIGIHFRNRTHGEIDFDNTHPYPVLSTEMGHKINLYMMHNGVISGMGTYRAGKSDTYEYIEKFLRPLMSKYEDSWRDERFMSMVGEHVGKSNKFLFFGDDGSVMTVNEKQGDEEGGVWYSNQQGKFSTTTHYSGYRGTGMYTGERWTESDWDEVRGVTDVSPAKGGGAEPAAPFCPSVNSNEPSDSTTPTSDVSETGNDNALTTIAARASKDTIRAAYLEGDLDPRIGGQDIPIEALRYLNEDDLTEVVFENPEGVADLLFTLGDSYDWGDHDLDFRKKVLGG
jgi:hypothetical protein